MKLVVCFPGIGYHCDKPLLYYSRKLAVCAGYDHTLLLQYTYHKDGLRGSPAALREAFDTLYAPADPWSDASSVAAAARANGTPLCLYENANHSLETGDVLHDLATLQDVMQKTQTFIADTPH